MYYVLKLSVRIHTHTHTRTAHRQFDTYDHTKAAGDVSMKLTLKVGSL